MARGQERKTERVRVNEVSAAPPRIEDHTRYISSRGSRNGIGLANSLREAFNVGQRFTEEKLAEGNREGVDRAVQQRASGAERDPSDENYGYNLAWDRLDAENDVNKAKAELTEYLRGVDSENLEEGELQGALNAFWEERFSGLDQMEDSEYARQVSRQIVGIETEVMADHRQAQIEQIREEQRTKIYENVQARLEETGEYDHQYAFEQTGIFFEGAEKKTTYREMVIAEAIRRGDVDIIDSMPETINGVPTGINDPALQDEWQAARNSALRTAANKQAQLDAAVKADNERNLYASQRLIAAKIARGEDVAEDIAAMALNPESDVAAENAAFSLANNYTGLIENSDFSPTYVNTAWRAIHNQDLAPHQMLTQITQAYADGLLGGGKEAETRYNSMVNAIESYVDDGTGGNPLTSQEANLYRTDLNKHFDKSLAGIIPDGFIARANAGATARYNSLLLEGKSPVEASDIAKTEYDKIIRDNRDTIDVNTITSKTTLYDFNKNYVVTAVNIERVIKEPEKAREVFGGIPMQQFESMLLEKVDAGEITPDQVNRLIDAF